MPIGALGEMRDQPVAMDLMLDLQRRFEVSPEAILLRIAKVTTDTIAAVAASRATVDSDDAAYQVDYFSPSRSFSNSAPVQPLRRGSVLSRCTAIGATARGREQWPDIKKDLWIECVGVPPYPGHVYPRVVGFVRDAEPSEPLETSTGIQYLEGDALWPSTPGHKIVAFVVNDKAKKWGGGFALEVRRTWPHVQDSFEREGDLDLGSIHVTEASDDITAVAMVAQHGYRPGPRPGIRYPALNTSLARPGEVALDRRASIHMPRIGAGQAGGDWDIIKELIEDNIIQRGISTTVYVLPGPTPKNLQLRFGMGISRATFH